MERCWKACRGRSSSEPFVFAQAFRWSSRANIVLSLRRLENVAAARELFRQKANTWSLLLPISPCVKVDGPSRKQTFFASPPDMRRWMLLVVVKKQSRKRSKSLSEKPRHRAPLTRLSHYVEFFSCRLRDLFYSRLFAELLLRWWWWEEQTGRGVVEPFASKSLICYDGS